GLWAVLAAVLRFVPYVGVVAAALAAMLVAAAVAPGWTLVLLTLGLFAVLELVVTQLVEPQLYGHTTGLSPLSIVVAAIFWSWLWGPIGLIVSTPLTLCLVVAGRHVEALRFLDVLLGDSQALTLPQRFYQRALSGDASEIIATARAFLKRRSFAAYCDMVLMRALRLTQLDLAAGTITTDQQHKVRRAIVQVIEALGNETRKRHRWPVRKSVLDELNAGRQLRQHRESLSGQWQGPLAVPLGSIALCIGLGTMGDDIFTEILVRVLRDLHIDARHLSIQEFGQPAPPGATVGSVSMVCIVGIASAHSQERRIAFARDVHQRLPEACVMDLLLGDEPDSIGQTGSDQQADLLATSFQDAAQQAMRRFNHQPEKPTQPVVDAS
ncbi:MAG: AI-2E family transporter, partial [Rhodoferax sp.]